MTIRPFGNTLPMILGLGLALGVSLSSRVARANDCAPGLEQSGALCYPPCRAGFKGVGPVCWQECPGGFRDDGAHCGKPAAYGRGAGYPWKFGDAPFKLDGASARCHQDNPGGCEQHGLVIYPKCRAGFSPAGCCICSPVCPAGMADIGVSCRKESYGRGAGRALLSVENAAKKVVQAIGTTIESVQTTIQTGVTGLVQLIEKAKPILDCAGISDIIDLTTRFFKNPGGTIQDTFGKVWDFVKRLGSAIFADGAKGLQDVIGLATGAALSNEAADRVMDLLWSFGERAATFSKQARCLMDLLKQHRGTIEPVIRTIAKTVLNLIPTVSNLVQDKLAEVAAGLIDKILAKLLGEDRVTTIKGFFSKVFGAEAIQEEAARRLDAAIQAMRTRAPNAASAWKHARALIAGTADDFGARKVLAHVQIATEQAAMLLVDLAIDELAKWGARLADTSAPTLANRIIDALCGLIPEAGAAICTFTVSLAIRLIWNVIGSEAVQQTVKLGLRLLAKPVVKKIVGLLAKKVAQALIRMPADWIQNKLGDLLNQGTGASIAAAWASRLVTPIVNFLLRIVNKWALPNAQGAAVYATKLGELGDLALAFAQGKAAPPRVAVKAFSPGTLKEEPADAPVAPAGPRTRRARGELTGRPRTMSEHFAGHLIHCGVKGTPTYATLAGCRIRSGPGCDTAAVPGQCSFPRPQAMALCLSHPQCRGITCNVDRGDCQARDRDEAQTLVPQASWGSRIALVFGGQRQDTVIHCGVPGQPGFDTVPGCRIRSGPGCVADGSGQCALPRAQAAEVCRANPQCRGFTCPNGSAYCYARDADEVRRSVRRRSGFSSTVSQ